MCVISMVYDHYTLKFPNPGEYVIDPESVMKMIADFYKARDAAKVVDELTGQPDCVDPEKAKLESRVAALEVELEKLKKQQKPKKGKKTNAPKARIK